MTESPGISLPLDLTAQAYRAIREAIVTLRFQPGQLLQESGLAREMGMSRTPVREALRRLQGEGLVEASPPRGVTVVALSIHDVENAYLVIEALEGLACRLAADRLTDDGSVRLRILLDRLTAASDSGDLDAWAAVDAEFHDAIRTIAANPKLNQFTSMVYPLIERVRHMHLREEPGPARLNAQTNDHRAIGEAIIARDADQAEELTRRLFADARASNLRLLRHWVVPLRRSF